MSIDRELNTDQNYIIIIIVIIIIIIIIIIIFVIIIIIAFKTYNKKLRGLFG